MCSIHLFGQDGFQTGYIVDLNGDTLSGFVDFKSAASNEKYCSFRTEINSTPQNYNPKQILGYGFMNGWVYRSNQFGMDLEKLTPSFVRIVVEGDVQLFWVKGKYFMRSSKSKYTYILNKDGKDHIRVLSAVLVNDCFELASEVSNVILTDEALLKLLTNYHECIDKPFVSYTRPKPRPLVGIAFESSNRVINANSVEFEDFNQTVESSGLTIKILLNQSFKPYSKWRYQLEAGYSLENNYLINLEATNNYETRFSFSSLYVAGNIGYAWPVGKSLVINGQLGLGGYFPLSSDQSRQVEVIVGNNIFIDRYDDSFAIGKHQFFFNQHVNVEYSFGNKKLFVGAFNRLTLSDPILASGELPNASISSSFQEMGITMGMLLALPSGK